MKRSNGYISNNSIKPFVWTRFYFVSWNDIDYNVVSQKSPILWCLGRNWDEEELRGKMMEKRKGFSKVW